MTDVFISYKAEEFDDANWVKQTLETNGFSCWMAPMSIPGGSSYAVEIPQAIRAAKVFVLILSEKTQLSRWVPRELDQAINEGKTILPFMLENCPLRDEFNFYLSNVQRYAAYENKSVALEKMINQIRAILYGDSEARHESGDNIKTEALVKADNKDSDISVDSNRKVERTVEDIKRKQIKTQKDKTKKESKKNKLILLIVIIGTVAAITALAIISIAFATRNTSATNDSAPIESDNEISTASKTKKRVTVAGKVFNRSDSYISLRDVKLSSGDITALADFEELGMICLTNCVIPADSLNSVFKAARYNVELVNCGLTNEELHKVDFKNVSANSICLDNNVNLTDVSDLALLGEKLWRLSFNGCSVTDISFVESLTTIRELSFDSNHVEDLSVLNKCSTLEKLSAAGNAIKDLTALSACKKLEEISVGYNALSNLDGLEHCVYLKKIYAGNNAITDIDGLQNATLLNDVDLSNNAIVDISLLSKSKGTLKKLNLSNNKIGNVDALSECSRLTQINISGNSVETLDALSALTEITSINASDNRIIDITGLKSSVKLTSVDLSNNFIVDTGSLSFDTSAYRISLDVSYNSISTLVIPKIDYYYLALIGNPISDLSVINETGGSTLVFDYDSKIDFESLSGSDFYDYYIIDCPLDKQISIEEIMKAYRTHFMSEQEFLDFKNKIS